MTESPDPGWRDADQSAGFDAMVAALDHFDAWRPMQRTRRVLYRALRPGINHRIQDAGCGTGFDVATLASCVQPGGHVHGIESSQRMVDLARERYGSMLGITFSKADVRQIPFPDATLDAVFAMRTLQYLDDPASALREMARATKPGGRVVAVEGGMSVMDLPSPELAKRILGVHWGNRAHSFGAELYRLLIETGLTDVRVVPVTTIVHEPGPYFLDHAREAAASGAVSPDEASAWLAELEARIAAGHWFAADCMFVAFGVVPRPGDL